jgi:hypothetical protein
MLHPTDGHIKAATVDNMQGGNARITRQKGERAVFQDTRNRNHT